LPTLGKLPSLLQFGLVQFIPFAELQARLRTSPPPEKARLLGKILREARDTDVWRFTSPAEVLQLWSE
jgi:hypothetical protein